MPLSKSIIEQTLALPYGEQAYKIVEKLTDAGFDTWWAGGCVRDMLRNIVPTDIDVATAATPDDILRIFPKATLTPKSLGSVRIPIGNAEYEVTTFREDDEKSDGRHPESVTFSTREKDGMRRDFTINALYFNPINSELYDPFNGEGDLKEGLIRFIGDPALRIKHDALRLLRAVRFHAFIDGQYHPDTYQAIEELAPLIETLSGTRQLEELEKMLLGPHPDKALEDLWELGLLERFLPELHACKGVPQPMEYHQEGDVWEHTLQCTRSFRSEDGIDVRIAALFHDTGKVETFSLKERIRCDHHADISSQIAEAALGRLQMPKKRIEKISWIIQHHMMMGSFADMNNERKAHWYHHPWFSELLQLFYLDVAGTTPSDFKLYQSIADDATHFVDSHPRPVKTLLSGEEIMDILHLLPGERVGEILQQLHAAQLSENITTKKEARTFIESLNNA